MNDALAKSGLPKAEAILAGAIAVMADQSADHQDAALSNARGYMLKLGLAIAKSRVNRPTFGIGQACRSWARHWIVTASLLCPKVCLAHTLRTANWLKCWRTGRSSGRAITFIIPTDGSALPPLLHSSTLCAIGARSFLLNGNASALQLEGSLQTTAFQIVGVRLQCPRWGLSGRTAVHACPASVQPSS